MGRRYVFCGGGTGGHVMPNLAVIREIQERDPSAEILYIGTARGAEAQLLRDAQIAFRSAPAKAFASPRRPRKFIPFVIALAIGVLKSLWHIARFKPDVVVATGGYVSVPPVLAAAILKRPVVLHEQNVEPGKANRLLARFATAIGVSFDDTLEYFPAKKVVVTGYPLRKRIATGDKAEARRRLAIPDDHRVCFVTGGSMGSRAINRAVVEGLNQLLANEKISVIHSTGLFETPEYNAFEDTKKRLGTIGLEPEKEGRYIYRRFFDNIEDAYAASDLIVARAGAGTLMEIAAMKKPAIFIPKGDAGDAHQLANALSAKKRGAAEVIYEEIYDEGGSAIARVHGDILAKKIRDLLLDDVKLDEMAKSNEGLVKPNAATRIFELVQKTAEGGEPAPRGTVPHLCGFLTSPDGREEEIIFTHSTASDRSTADIRLALRCRDRAIFRRYGKSAAETEFVIVPREGVVRVNEQTITKPVTLTVGDTVDIGPNRFTFSTKVMDVELPEGGRGMVRSVFATGIGTLASRLFGLTREAVLATSFGAGRVMDVFATSLNAANLLRRIFAENAADSAFLPTFLLLFRGGKKDEARRLFRTTLTTVVILSTLVTVVGIVTAPYWLKRYVPGFAEKGLTGDTIALTRLMMPYLVLIAVASLMAAVLKAFNRFGLTAWASIMFSFGIMLGSALYPRFGIAGLGIGVLAGGIGQILMQLPPFLSKEFREGHRLSFAPLFAWREPGMRKIRATAPKIVADVAISKCEVVVNTALASTLAIGHNSVLYYAMLLQQLPFALISLSISSVMLKEFSERQALRDGEAAKRLVVNGINWNAFLLIPTSALMAVLAEPTVRLLFEYRKFDAEHTHLVALALQCYSIGLVGWGVQGLMDRIYAARMEVGQAIAINAAAITLNIVLARLFVSMGMQSAGIALATSFAFLANAGFRVWHVRKNMAKDGTAYELSHILPSLKKTLVASITAATIAYFVFQTVDGFNGIGRFLSRLVVFLLPCVSGIASFIVASLVLRSPEMDEIAARFRRKRPAHGGGSAKPIDINLHALPPARLLAVIEKNPEVAKTANLTRRVEDFLRSPHWQVKNIGVKLIGKLGIVAKRYDLKKIIEDREPARFLHRILGGDFKNPGFVRRNALDSLVQVDTIDETLETAILTGLRDPYFEVKSAAARAVAHFAPRLTIDTRAAAANELRRLLEHKNFEVQVAAIHALQAAADDESVLALFEPLHYHMNWRIRQAVVNAYLELYKRGVVEDRMTLVTRLEDILVTCESFRPIFDLKEALAAARTTILAAKDQKLAPTRARETEA